MSEIKELQDEEREALISIYEGDVAFKQVNPVTYQYKYGDENDGKTCLLELTWTDNYPNEPPTFNLDTFYNRDLITPVKDKIISVLNEEAQQWLGCGMTYTLFECLKEKLNEVMSEQPDTPQNAADLTLAVDKLDITSQNIMKAPKKEQLTKAQKRRQWERTDHKGDRPRGWNWVDIVKHLSQTGGKDDSGTPPS